MAFFTVTQFADILKVSNQTVRKMIRDKRLLAVRLSDKGKARYRIPESQLEVFQIKSFNKQFNTEEKKDV